jgi:hypothetical protein
MSKWKQTVKIGLRNLLVLVCSIAPFWLAGQALADPTYKSTNYGVDEVFMGSGGLNDTSSASYKARASLGDIAVGNTGSATYQAYGGFVTTADPYIELVVNPTNVDLGYLSSGSASTTSATFTIRTWLASGYIIVNGSDPPSYTSGGNTPFLTALATPTGYSTNTEMFGINLIDNSSPDIGATPVQIPDASYSFGQVDADYAHLNQFMYVKGDTIAYSTKSSSVTQYTVSYLYGIATETPAGQYTFNHSIVATSTY